MGAPEFLKILPLKSLLTLSCQILAIHFNVMVAELKDPEFKFTTRIVTARSTISVPQLGPNDVDGQIHLRSRDSSVTVVRVSLGVAGFVRHAIENITVLKSTAMENGYLDAVQAGTHAYTQAVLNNLKNELTGSKAEKVRNAPVSIKKCAVRTAGGWGQDAHDRYCFEEACQDMLGYSEQQYCEC